MSQRVKEYHKWLVQRARKQFREARDNYEAAQKNPSLSNDDLEYAKQFVSASYEAYAFVELADPENYAAHKRDKKTRREQGL